MVTGVHGVDSSTAIRKVNDTLQGTVVDILSQLVPELKKLPRAQAYERTLDDIGLLDRCFTAFRAERQRFTAILVDSSRQPVTDDKTVMPCGRSLEQVVAMIVRTAAKRYFRRRLSPMAADKPLAPRLHAEAAKGLIQRVAAAFADDKPGKPQAPRRSLADELYDALKENLVHEWQVPLVPTYASMAPNLARELGAKLLDIRDLAQLQKIVDDPSEAAKLFDIGEDEARQATTAPAESSAGHKDERARLSDILAPGGARLKTDAFNTVLRKDELRALVKDGHSTPRMAEVLSGVGGMPAKLLVAELGLRMDQLATLLLVANEALGPDMFVRMFGQPGDTNMVMKVTQKARLAGLSQRTPLPDCAKFIRETFARPD